MSDYINKLRATQISNFMKKLRKNLDELELQFEQYKQARRKNDDIYEVWSLLHENYLEQKINDDNDIMQQSDELTGLYDQFDAVVYKIKEIMEILDDPDEWCEDFSILFAYRETLKAQGKISE